MLLPYQGTWVIFSIIQCHKCYTYKQIKGSPNLKCGALVNFILFLPMFIIVILFKILVFHMIEASTTFGIFSGAGVYCALCGLLMVKLNRARTYKRNSKVAFYDSTLIILELFMIIIQISLFFGFYLNQSPYNFDDILGL